VTHITGLYPRLHVDTAGSAAVGQAGGVLLVETIRTSGIDRGLSTALAPWRRPLATHAPGKIVLDLAIALALGGDCLADVNLLRAEPGVFGRIASDPTVSRLIDTLAADADQALATIEAARADARARVWTLAGQHAPGHGADVSSPLIIDLDATLVTAHSEKQHAAPTFKRGYGFHPLCAFVDHGPSGTGEPLHLMLRPGNAGSNTAADHIAVTRKALAQLPGPRPGTRPGRKVLIRTDAAGSTHAFLDWLTERRLSYSIGFTLGDITDVLAKMPAAVWTPAYTGDGGIREGAWVAELTGLLDLSGWPAGMRVIARKERPHPGAQLRLTDVDGHRITAFVTNTRGGQLPDLELRHRRRARAEDRIRNAKDTGLTNLPLHDFDQNRIWCALVGLAAELTAWMQLLAFTSHEARRWEPKRLRYRIFTIAAQLARTGRRVLLHLATRSPWAALAAGGIHRLQALAVPG
jgi:Transposase DDE domain group 1